MTYIFFLGNHPGISIAEILAYFKRKDIEITEYRVVFEGILLIKSSEKLDIKKVISELGGTIKIGELMTWLKGDVETGAKLMMDELMTLDIERLHYGFSAYGVRINKTLGLNMKREIIALGRMARWVVSRDAVLSSVIIEQNKLLTHGFEFSFIKSEGKIMLVKTLAVQPFKELSKRDYGRPGRDDQSGMLPPKLAQMMLNMGLVKKDTILLDPFCGSGTVLSEALLLGVESLLGSDISERAVEDTQVNLEWTLGKNQELRLKNQNIRHESATELSKTHKANSIDVIVTEPFLGPQRGDYDVRDVVLQLESLYAKAITEFAKVLKNSGRVVMVWPVFKTHSDRIFMSAKIVGQLNVVKPLPGEFKGALYNLTNRNTLLYGRPDQRVWREIVILTK